VTLDDLLPRTIDNTYRGHKLALWLFGLVVLAKVGMGLSSIFDGYGMASSADGIPLDTYPPTAVRAIVSILAVLGLSHLVIGALCILVLVRYRGLVPFMFALLLLEHLTRRLILQVMPIARAGRPPTSAVNLALIALMVVGLALSLWRRSRLPAGAS
jgi:hypothetical protein